LQLIRMFIKLPMLRWFIFLTLFLTLTPSTNAQEADVYLVKIFGCAHKPAERSQTGFRVRGIKGLVTALHGVADCQKITASSRKGLLLDQPLIITKIDADHDVVLLSSSQLESSPDGGLYVADNVIWESLGTVKVYGHPYGISNLERTLLVSNPALKPLKDLVPATPLFILKERRSPNHLINVLNLQGHLLPGHSGAPILDSRGRVVAVASGGLKGGYADISWAIPFEDIEWDANLYQRLKALAQYDPTILFDYDTGEPIAEAGTDFCGQISKLIAASHTKFESESIVGEPTLDGFAGEYKSKIPLPGATASFVLPGQYVRYRMYMTNSPGWGFRRVYKKLVAKLRGCLPGSTKREFVVEDDKFSIREGTTFKGDDNRPNSSIFIIKQADKFELNLQIMSK
jgi:Trypsin-like peptidase domain